MGKRIAFILVALFLGSMGLYAQSQVRKSAEAKPKTVVKVLETSPDKEKGILKLNDSLFLVSNDDVMLLTPEQMDTFGIYVPGTDEFNQFLKEYQIKPDGVAFIFYATTRPNAKIPEKFKDK